MQTLKPSAVLLAEIDSKSEHLGTIESILKQADIEVLNAEELSAPSGNYFEWLAHITIEHRPSAIILSLDWQTLANDLLLTSYLGSIPADIPIIVAARDFEVPQIHAALNLGAADYLLPPFTSASVLPRVWRLIKHNTARPLTRESLREKLGMYRSELLGESPAFLKEIKKVPAVARCDVTVMVLGETGTGKELVARAVHYLSARRDRPFVPIDCGAIPPDLAESELFGHERGAFTGAVTKNPGLISAADQGTLFLDEVDGLRPDVQAKLLRFLQHMEYRPLGSNKIKRANVRVISATNVDLEEQVRNGQFRKDLYYRLKVVQIGLPALRQRREDVVLLARHFVAKYAARFNRPARDFSRDALQMLLMHAWPGNIRELENVVEAAVALSDGPLIRGGDLLFEAQGTFPPASFREAKERAIRQFEHDYIVNMLSSCGGNISEAARSAGKNRRAFWELIRKHGLDIQELKDSAGGERKTRARAARAGGRFSTRD